MKYTEAQARAIMTDARATVARVNADQRRWAAEDDLRQRSGGGFLTRTTENARIDAAVQETLPVDANAANWAAWVEERIDEKLKDAVEVMGGEVGKLLNEVDANLQRALDQRDRAIQALRDEIDAKIAIGRKVARLKAEIAEARRQQPNFEVELAELKSTIEKQARLITRSRGEQSQLSFAQKELETKQWKDRQEIKLTLTQLSAVAGQTREVLERLHAEGVDFEQWTPVSLAS